MKYLGKTLILNNSPIYELIYLPIKVGHISTS